MVMKTIPQFLSMTHLMVRFLDPTNVEQPQVTQKLEPFVPGAVAS